MSVDNKDLQIITLGGGCFWCLEAVFERMRGVAKVESGYSNGHVREPTYEQVCSGTTGHAEVVRVSFDPDQVSLRTLLEVFFYIHDPTTLNRQGADQGPQYRSGIYVHNAEQATVARAMMADVQAKHSEPLVTELESESNYWPAEGYHQHYFERNPEQGYCVFVVGAKVDKFELKFSELMRKD
ncbi:MAG: peptide-methionine (S)-S-oxide reductase MsrA [Burkholderiaceae bacterium]|nr:peptide-methionine (S)-S-oxide reductase MsrA [Roseateles sp.]MBV8468719.1 peptide-methionine (S)-S-oxide reductase MsrA [Burkholderiaceae bacterium]